MPAGDYHRPIKGGTYEVTFSCDGYRPKTFTLTVADGETLVQDVRLVSDWYGGEEMTAGALRVYPNPTDRVLVIEMQGIATLQGQAYCVCNIMGQVVLQGQITDATQRIDVAALPQGMYFITVGAKTRRFATKPSSIHPTPW